MNTRQALKASLEITPPRAHWTMRHVRIANVIESIVEKALRDVRARDWPNFHYHIEWAARLFLGIAEPEDFMASRATVQETSTEALRDELRRRALEENDRIAARALKIPLPSRRQKEKGRVRA